MNNSNRSSIDANPRARHPEECLRAREHGHGKDRKQAKEMKSLRG
jgi:hypothetical protein